jgi:hypothetical protein
MDLDKLMGAIDTIEKGNISNLMRVVLETGRLRSTHCEKESLGRSIQNLPNLDAITATSSYCFDGCGVDLVPIWNFITEWYMNGRPEKLIYQHRETSAERYTNIILASGKIKLLVLDPFPVDALLTHLHNDAEDSEDSEEDTEEPEDDHDMDIDSDKSTTLQRSVSHIEHLKIGIGGSLLEYWNPAIAQAVTSFLDSLSSLRYLDLTDELDQRGAQEYQSAFRDSFCKLRFPNLTELRLRRIALDPEPLVLFLKGHKSSIRHLSLGHHSVWFGRVPEPGNAFIDSQSQELESQERNDKDFLSDLRQELALEKFEYVPWTDDLELTDPLIYTDQWESLVEPTLQNYSPDGTASYNTLALTRHRLHAMKTTKALEMFVFGKSPWPMRKDGPSKDVSGKWTWARLSDEELKAGFTDLPPTQALLFELLISDESDEGDDGVNGMDEGYDEYDSDSWDENDAQNDRADGFAQVPDNSQSS